MGNLVQMIQTIVLWVSSLVNVRINLGWGWSACNSCWLRYGSYSVWELVRGCIKMIGKPAKQKISGILCEIGSNVSLSGKTSGKCPWFSVSTKFLLLNEVGLAIKSTWLNYTTQWPMNLILFLQQSRPNTIKLNKLNRVYSAWQSYNLFFPEECFL